MDATGAAALKDLAVELRRDGVSLLVARMRPQVQERLVAGEISDAISDECFFPTVRAAVSACLERDVSQVERPS